MAYICRDCNSELRQIETNFLETSQVWELGFAPVALEGWACPHCGQVRFYASDAAALFGKQAPELIPMTMKEAYGNVLPVAIEWDETAELCAIYSGGDDEDVYVDIDGQCTYWSFTFRTPQDTYLDLVVTGRIVKRSPYEFEGDAGASFVLEDLLDSPDIITQARAAELAGKAFTLALERDDNGTLRALVVSPDGSQQIRIDPTLQQPEKKRDA